VTGIKCCDHQRADILLKETLPQTRNDEVAPAWNKFCPVKIRGVKIMEVEYNILYAAKKKKKINFATCWT